MEPSRQTGPRDRVVQERRRHHAHGIHVGQQLVVIGHSPAAMPASDRSRPRLVHIRDAHEPGTCELSKHPGMVLAEGSDPDDADFDWFHKPRYTLIVFRLTIN